MSRTAIKPELRSDTSAIFFSTDIRPTVFYKLIPKLATMSDNKTVLTRIPKKTYTTLSTPIIGMTSTPFGGAGRKTIFTGVFRLRRIRLSP